MKQEEEEMRGGPGFLESTGRTLSFLLLCKSLTDLRGDTGTEKAGRTGEETVPNRKPERHTGPYRALLL